VGSVGYEFQAILEWRTSDNGRFISVRTVAATASRETGVFVVGGPYEAPITKI